MGNNASCKVIGVGTIRIKMFDGVVRALGDLRHVPNLKRDLISLSTLDAKGYKYSSECGVMTVRKSSLIVMKGEIKSGRLYVLWGSTFTRDAAADTPSLSDSDVTRLWHLRLGHMSENGMIVLSKRGLLDGQSISKLFCEHCVLSKQKKVKFSTGIHNTTWILDYIHYDLWGPSGVSSMGGTYYMLTIIDDFSSKI